MLRNYPRFLLFGMLHMFFSSPGQSFSVAVFVPSFTAAFGLTASGFGLQYSTATLVSACLLPFFGPQKDADASVENRVFHTYKDDGERRSTPSTTRIAWGRRIARSRKRLSRENT